MSRTKPIKLSARHPLVIKVSDYFKEGTRGFANMEKKMTHFDAWNHLSERLRRKIYNIVEKNLNYIDELDLEK